MHLIADAAAALGSRFNLIFDPHGAALYHNAYGEFREQALSLTVGIRTPDGEVWSLPFTGRAQHFPHLEQFSTLTAVQWRGVQPDLGVEFTMTVRAPFYPRDARLSTAPFYYVDLAARQIGAFRWTNPGQLLDKCEIIFALNGDEVRFKRDKAGLSYSFTSTSVRKTGNTLKPDEGERRNFTVNSRVRCAHAARLDEAGFALPADLGDGAAATMNLVWTSWSDQPVLELFGEPSTFKYHQYFDSEDEMARWALAQREDIERRCKFLDESVSDWSLGRATSNMAALALHSFLVNTWWTLRAGGGDWFSVWEGSCYFHSTVDVEYNDALLYFALWPELLEMLLDEWPGFEIDGRVTLGESGKGTGFLSHDMGSQCVVGRQSYPHPMEVEENANYLLLLAGHAMFTGRTQKVKEKLPLCRRLAEFIVQCDTNGNGMPDRGTANTIDDASVAVQFGREQVYLAVKSQAALWALAELEEACDPQNSQAERWRACASKSIKTLEEQAWLDDHYAVTLTRTTEGILDPWTGEPLPPGELEGWDDYSIYAANGLLYLFLANLSMPRWRTNRFALDIENAARRCMTHYGCTHTASGDSTVWFSQNMWRDYVAAYLGLDMLNNVERYWEYQTLTGDNFSSALYYDTTPQNNLCFYPRGTVVFGAPLSAAGLRLNHLEKTLLLSPLRPSLRVPLLPLADWQKMRVPYLTVRCQDGVIVAEISNRDLLEGLRLEVTGAELRPGPAQ